MALLRTILKSNDVTYNSDLPKMGHIGLAHTYFDFFFKVFFCSPSLLPALTIPYYVSVAVYMYSNLPNKQVSYIF